MRSSRRVVLIDKTKECKGTWDILKGQSKAKAQMNGRVQRNNCLSYVSETCIKMI